MLRSPHALLERLKSVRHARREPLWRLELALLGRCPSPRIVGPPTERDIIVLAPHMDDETFGCGGTLARAAAENGARVVVVFLTDGAKGYEPSRLADREPGSLLAFERDLVGRRKGEARAACRALGFDEPRFLDGPDGALRPTAALAEAVADALNEREAGAVFLPFVLDQHPDHWATNAILAEAAPRLRTAPAVWGYEIWTPLIPNRVVDISPVAGRKRDAAARYVSQNACRDYPASINGLNTYRAVFLEGAGSEAEAFVTAPLGDYLDLYATLARRPPNGGST